MKIDIDLEEGNPQTTLEFDDNDISRMWNYLMTDRWYFEEYIVDYLIENFDCVDCPNLLGLYKMLEERYANNS